jgi:toxin FitB
LSYLLDTNVLSELRKGRRCDHAVATWYAALGENDVFLSVLVVGEIRRGIERIRRRDAVSARAIDRWLAAVVSAHADRILPVDREIAEEWGRLAAPRPLPVIDGLLAATAKVRGLTLATRNLADVASTGVACVDPFESP